MMSIVTHKDNFLFYDLFVLDSILLFYFLENQLHCLLISSIHVH
jgi:hypothetical protein